MTQILPGLYLGDIRDAMNTGTLYNRGINIIINTSNSVPNFLHGHNINGHNVIYINSMWDDHPSQRIFPDVDKMADFIHSARIAKRPILVHCYAGISRSSSTVLWYLMKYYNMDFDQALEYIRKLHPRARPNVGFERQLRNSKRN